MSDIEPRAATEPPARGFNRGRTAAVARRLLAFGMAAPVLAVASALAATAAYPGLDPSSHYLSELGGQTASRPMIFNAGVFVAGVMAALAGVGFGLGLVALTRARIAGGLTAAVFIVSGYGLTQATLYPWPDPRHLAINLALGIQLAPLLLVWGVWSRRDLSRLKLFLLVVSGVMAVLTVLTRHLIFPGLVNDGNVGLWERAYAILLVSWVGIAALALDRCLRRETMTKRTA